MRETLAVSVVMPVCNGAKYLAQAIASVLEQSRPPDEVIVVDDGSSDESVAIAARFGPVVRLFRQPNRGVAAARNLGIGHATGNLLAFLDQDDLWTPDKLALQLAALRQEPAHAAVLGRVENFISPDLDEGARRPLARAARQAGNIHVGALLIRRAAFARIGGFDPRWRQCEFVEWWARATHLGLAYALVPQLVLRRRLHAANQSRLARDGRREYLFMLSEHLARRGSG